MRPRGPTDPFFYRTLPLGLAVLIILVLVGTAGGVFTALGSHLSYADTIATVTAWLTAAGLFLAFVAALIALAAYLIAMQRPNLNMTFEVVGHIAGMLLIDPSITNLGKATARNTSVRLRIPGEVLQMLQTYAGWILEPDRSFRWDSTADLSIHPGDWPIPLPRIAFTTPEPKPPSMEVTYSIVADGFKADGKTSLKIREP